LWFCQNRLIVFLSNVDTEKTKCIWTLCCPKGQRFALNMSHFRHRGEWNSVFWSLCNILAYLKMPFNIYLGWHMFYTEQWMGGRGRRMIIAPLEVKSPRPFYLFGGAIINLRPRPPMYYSLNNNKMWDENTWNRLLTNAVHVINLPISCEDCCCWTTNLMFDLGCRCPKHSFSQLINNKQIYYR